MVCAVHKGRLCIFPRKAAKRCVEDEVVHGVETKFHNPHTNHRSPVLYGVQCQGFHNLQQRRHTANDGQCDGNENEVEYKVTKRSLIFRRTIRRNCRTCRLEECATKRIQQRRHEHIEVAVGVFRTPLIRGEEIFPNV